MAFPNKRRNKSFEQQNKYYECEDYRYFLIDRWILGIEIYPYYNELSRQCKYEFIEWLLIDKPHEDWIKIALYCLNPKHKLLDKSNHEKYVKHRTKNSVKHNVKQ